MQAIKRLTPFIAVAAQLEPADMGTLAASGFRTVINTNAHAGQTVFHLHLHVIGGPRPWARG